MTPPCPPFSACWCKDHPTHPACRDIGIPVSDWWGEIALITIILLLFYIVYKKKTRNEKV